MNPEIFTLSLIEWQLFATLTFKSVKLTDAVRIKMFFALMRTQAGNFGVHFKKTIWCLRSERGESTGREHLHALIAGFPKHALTTATCFSFLKIWEGQGGGMARVTLYSPSLDGVGYVLKGGEAEYVRAGGDYYRPWRNRNRISTTRRYHNSQNYYICQNLARGATVDAYREPYTTSASFARISSNMRE
jgi:hypothetical protein